MHASNCEVVHLWLISKNKFWKLKSLYMWKICKEFEWLAIKWTPTWSEKCLLVFVKKKCTYQNICNINLWHFYFLHALRIWFVKSQRVISDLIFADSDNYGISIKQCLSLQIKKDIFEKKKFVLCAGLQFAKYFDLPNSCSVLTINNLKNHIHRQDTLENFRHG